MSFYCCIFFVFVFLWPSGTRFGSVINSSKWLPDCFVCGCSVADLLTTCSPLLRSFCNHILSSHVNRKWEIPDQVLAIIFYNTQKKRDTWVLRLSFERRQISTFWERRLALALFSLTCIRKYLILLFSVRWYNYYPLVTCSYHTRSQAHITCVKSSCEFFMLFRNTCI